MLVTWLPRASVAETTRLKASWAWLVCRCTVVPTASVRLVSRPRWSYADSTTAATAVHEKAQHRAGQVAGHVFLAETARLDAEHARDRAALLEAEASAALLAPTGAR